MKLIRWSGIAAFIIIVGLVVGFWYFFADNLLKYAIESSASDAAEAEVSIDELDISFLPLGIEIKKLEVANSQSPMRNTLQLDRAVAHMNLLKLLQGQVIIDSIAAEGLRFDTQRSRASNWKKKIEPPAPPEDGDSLFNMPDIQLQLPDVDDVLKKEDLITTKMSQQLQTHYDEQQQKLDAAFKRIPDLEKFNTYETRIKTVTSGKVTSIDNFKQRKQELDAIHNEIRADQQAIKDVKTQLTTSKELLSDDIKALKAAPGQDVNNLKDKFTLDEFNTANFSKMLFGDQAGDWTKQGLHYYNKIKPVLESGKKEKRVRLKGRYVHFRSEHPSPDFLIRDMHIDVQLSFGHLSAKLKDLTHQMHITGKPATLAVRGVKLNDMKSVAVDGVFNHIRPNHASDRITFKIDDIVMKELQIVKSSSLPITINRANIDVTGELLLEKELTIHTEARFNPVTFSSHADSTLGKMFATAFTDIAQFYVSGDIRSDFHNYDVKIKSDIDEQIKQSLKHQWDARVAAFQQKIKDRLDAEEQKVRNRIETELAKLDQKKVEIENKLDRSEQLLKAKVDDFKDQQKQQLDQKKNDQVDKLKNSLKNKLKL